jgi:hypothetical protein
MERRQLQRKRPVPDPSTRIKAFSFTDTAGSMELRERDPDA